MKYIIEENQLSKVISKYITMLIGDLECTPSIYNVSITWCKSKGITIFSFNNTRLLVRDHLYNSVQEMFSLSKKQTNQAFKKWVFDYNGREFPDGVIVMDY
jgi:predicted transcriptional regulator